MNDGAHDRPISVAIIVVPRFSLMAFSSTVEPLRSANLVSGRTLYRWHYYSTSGGVMRASSDLPILTEKLSDAIDPLPDLVVVAGGMEIEGYRSKPLEAYLRQVVRHGRTVIAVSTATFVLAEAGLLSGRRCTIHWEYRDALREAFPDLDVGNDLFVQDGPIVTCAGGTAALDLMLQMVQSDHGDGLANAVSDQFVHGGLREPGTHQQMDVRHRLGVIQPAMVKAIRMMEETAGSPCSVAEIAATVGVSTRQLERLFQKHLACSPRDHYLRVRLEKARNLLRHTTLSVTEIAIACGFESTSHFSKSYRLAYGRSPSADRQADRMTLPISR